jgi:hypothetical protein
MGKPMDMTCPFKFIGETTGEDAYWCEKCGCIGYAKPFLHSNRQNLVDIQYPHDSE